MAESTGLEAGSVDLITVGQAFHWFDPDAARSEFRRILKPQGHLALDSPEYEPMPESSDGIFERHQENGVIRLHYWTAIYCGRFGEESGRR